MVINSNWSYYIVKTFCEKNVTTSIRKQKLKCIIPCERVTTAEPNSEHNIIKDWMSLLKRYLNGANF